MGVPLRTQTQDNLLLFVEMSARVQKKQKGTKGMILYVILLIIGIIACLIITGYIMESLDKTLDEVEGRRHG